MRSLPRKLAERIDQDLPNCRNLGLILDKYQPWRSSGSRAGWSLQFQIQEEVQHQWVANTTEDINKSKGHWLARSQNGNRVRRIDSILNPNGRIEQSIYSRYYDRWIDTIQQAGGTFIIMRNLSRLVIGLGAKGTLEMGLTLHHHIGYPWIPGSALKGVARTWALFWLAEQWGVPAVDNQEFLKRKKEKKTTPLQKLDLLIETPIGSRQDPTRLDALSRVLQSLQQDPQVDEAKSPLMRAKAADLDEDPVFQKIRSIFGGLGQAGEVIFFGGMVETKPNLVPEIITPHFNNYYRDGTNQEYPLDTDSPVPNVFLAVEQGQIFWFGFAARSPQTDEELVKKALTCARKGLVELGIGGKTSSGMGLFEKVQ